MTLGLSSDFEVSTLDSLTSAGVTSSVQTAGVNLTFQVTVSSIGTNVVVRFEGSLDDTNFANLDEDAEDTTITANGTTIYSLSGTPVKFIRVRLVSLSGGSPTVSTKVGVV